MNRPFFIELTSARQSTEKYVININDISRMHPVTDGAVVLMTGETMGTKVKESVEEIFKLMPEGCR